MARGQMKKVLRPIWRGIPPSARNRFIHRSLSLMTEAEKFRTGVPTVPGLLANMRENGFAPATILDVGANVGD